MTKTKTEDQIYHKLENSRDLDPLIEKIGDSRYVLLGEATHGTHEYYTWRTAITKRLIEEKGFNFIAVEGDWPDCYKINRFIKGHDNQDKKVVELLKQFTRWPTWMWSNWEIAALVEWLQQHNNAKAVSQKVGFYGLDVYSLWDSINVIIEYLDKEDPKTAEVARKTFNCFSPYEEGQDYAKAVQQISASCTDEVIDLLTQIRKKSANYDTQVEASLNAEMNALVVAHAEEYYRSMVSFDDDSWNLRDSHMVTALNSLMDFHGDDAKVIVWEHNTHVGDARATSMKRAGHWNVGQLVREQQEEDDVFIAGFSSYEGSVIAGDSWGAPMRKMNVPPAKTGSLEEILHSDSSENKLLFSDNEKIRKRFKDWIGHRAIGVVYHPNYEFGNYVSSIMPERYDAMLYIDKSNALNPLTAEPEENKVPETYPFGI